ncbi:glutamine synthetase family protein [Ketobacter sp.]|uniref:glutamine synthetase family protein n=1 Tax=Ketobacter sp. TaxID=2083498 RepID=UPI000F27D7FE|nr:glutamine synthetase [Ketobacter sp.]MEE2733033.1 glutamine synthetase [Pseudomonadota bacterium]RLU00750.1 MAG: glutamine synthetase [Ketobacter sp.]
MTDPLDPRKVHTVEQAKAIVQQRELSHVKVGVADIDGVIRGKYMSREKFFSALDKGFGFCDVVLGWDSNDQLYEGVNIQYTGWQTGYPDAQVRIVPDSCREVYGEPGMLFFLAEFDGAAEAICPRGVLKRILEMAGAMGFEAKTAFEYEFFLFNETPHSVREKGYRNLNPITPGFFGYSVLRSSVHAELYQELLALSQQMDFPVEGLHTETGPGVLEAAIAVDNALDAADKALLFKTFTKVWAQRNNMMATFMAKWSNDYPGQSGHIHISLQNKHHQPVFHQDGALHNMSELQRQFVAGQQKYMAELTAMYAQTVNAYSRMIPGFWAPTHATWGVENRTTSLRVIPGSEKSQRVEFRFGSADANPYIALAAALGSGLMGIEQRLTLEPQVTGNAYEQTFPDYLELPHTLERAAGRLAKSQVAQDLFGKAFVDHYVGTRLWEAQEFRKHITDWELKRYFEII